MVRPDPTGRTGPGQGKGQTLTSHTSTLRQLLSRDELIVVPGAYDALTARLVELAGFPVVYVTGAGISNSQLALADVGLMTMTEVLEQVRRMIGAASLDRALQMVRDQATRTPPGQWVRVIGGWSPHQFVEKRMPTVTELSEAAPNTPVFVLYLYSRGLLNRAGLKALGIDRNTVSTSVPGGGSSSQP